MKSDLIIVIFPHEDQAFQARQALEIMRGRQLFGLDNAALVTKDKAGRAAIHQRWDLPAYPRGPWGHLPVLFADAIFGPTPEQGAQRLAEAGLDESFLKDVSKELVSFQIAYECDYPVSIKIIEYLATLFRIL